jgi:hypothetical protein
MIIFLTVPGKPALLIGAVCHSQSIPDQRYLFGFEVLKKLYISPLDVNNYARKESLTE